MCPEGGSNGNDGNVLGVSHSEMCPDGFQRYPTSGCVQRGFNGNVLGGVSYIEMCPEGVQW